MNSIVTNITAGLIISSIVGFGSVSYNALNTLARIEINVNNLVNRVDSIESRVERLEENRD